MDKDFLTFIEACRAGNSTHWNEVRSIALGFLRRRCSASANDHADIVQEVIIKLLHGFHNFNGTTEQELRQYIKVATMREAVSWYRKNSRHQSHESIDQPLGDGESGLSLHDLLQDTRLHPDSIAEINQLYRKATERLSIRDRQILLYKIEGYKDREIAELLDIPMNTVASSYNRLKEQLQKTLAVILLIILFGRKLTWVASL